MQGLWASVHAAILCRSIHYAGRSQKAHGNQLPYLGNSVLPAVSSICITYNPETLGVVEILANLYLQKYCMGSVRPPHHMHDAASMQCSLSRRYSEPATTSLSNPYRPREHGSEKVPWAHDTAIDKQRSPILGTNSQCQVRPCEGYGSKHSLGVIDNEALCLCLCVWVPGPIVACPHGTRGLQ